MNLRDCIEKAAQSASTQQNALTDGHISCTYREMPKLFEQIGKTMQTQGAQVEDCIGFECANSVADAIALLYLFAHNYPVVLLPPSKIESSEIESNKIDSNKGDVNGAAHSELKPIPNFCRYRLRINPADGAAGQADALDPDQFLQLQTNAQYNGLDVREAHAQPNGTIYLRTSGSMGTSKIVVHGNEKMLGNARNCVEKYQFESTDRVTIPVPVAHMYGFGAVFLPAIIVGASIDLQEKSNLLKYLNREKNFKPNVAYLTPTLCDMLLRAFKTPRAYKVIVTSGQRINDQLFREFDARVGGCLVNQYGSSEMGAIAACDPGDPVDLKDTSIGQPMTDVQFRIDNPQPESGIGELMCRHPFGFDGYVDEEGDWITRCTPDEWYRTGDLAQPDENGDIYVVGRAANSVNRNGYLVLFSDIERIMEQFEQIRQVVVVASSEEGRRGQELAAFCVPELNANLDGQQIRTSCFDKLPNYVVPDEVHVVDALPLLPSGKVDQRMLQEMVESQKPERAIR